jgi:hypothetical protein
MLNITKHVFKALLLSALTFSAFSCSTEDEPLPDTSMELTVVDEIGNPVNGALVKVYADYEGYRTEDTNKLIGTAETSDNGKAIVMGGLEAKQYYFSIKHIATSIKTNWEGANTTQTPLSVNKINTTSVVIKDNVVNYLAGDNKKWKVHQVFINDIDMTSEFDTCWLDNITTYYKDKTILFAEGNTKCASSDPQTYNGVFSLNGNIFTTNDEVDGPESSIITELTGGTFTLAQQDANGNIIELTMKMFQ